LFSTGKVRVVSFFLQGENFTLFGLLFHGVVSTGNIPQWNGTYRKSHESILLG